MSKRLSEDEAIASMRLAGLEPLDPYPGVDRGWRSKCLTCSREVSPSLGNVRRNGVRCRFCSRGGMTWPEVEELLASRGLVPLAQETRTHVSFPCECVKCGRQSDVRLIVLRRSPSAGCAYCARRRVDAREVVEAVRAAGFEPLEDYTTAVRLWRLRCMTCSRVVRKSWNSIQSGKGCPNCSRTAPLSEAQARKEYRRAGLEPIGPFPGGKGGWESRCVRCGSVVSPHYNSVMRGGGCRGCATYGYNSRKPAVLYVLHKSDPPMFKVGVTNDEDTRLHYFERYGWEALCVVEFDTGSDALKVENLVLGEVRGKWGLAPALTKQELPNGWSETFSAADVSRRRLLALVDRMTEVVMATEDD